MYTPSNLAAVKMFTTAASKFNVLEEAIIAALQHLKNQPNASIEEALTVGLMDWDVPLRIQEWEKQQQDIEDSLPF